MRKTLALWLGIIFAPITHHVFAEDIDVLSYYTSSPLYRADKSGLVGDIIDAMNDNEQGYRFTYKLVSRPLLNKLISNIQRPFVVPLVNPVWFGDRDKTKYGWSIPLYRDHNALISPHSSPIDFLGRESFYDQTVGVPSGYRIHLLDDMVKEGASRRMDLPSIEALVHKVAINQIKMAVVPFVMAYEQVKQNGWQDLIYFSKRPHQEYSRYFMFVNTSEKMTQDFNAILSNLKSDGTLAGILKEYGY